MSASDDKPAVKVGTAKNGGKAKKLTASQATKKGDGAKLVTHLCSNCGASEGNLRCLDCGVERYCGKACQKVRGDAAGKPVAHTCTLTLIPATVQSSTQEHWRCGGHKKACKAYVLAATAQAQQDRLCKAAVEADRCLICMGPPREPTRMPCGHSFCTGCVGELRSKGVSETCPLCRAPLPPGPEKLYELAVQVRTKITAAVGTNMAWPTLSASQQGEMDGAIVMFQEAMDQVSGRVRDIR